MKIWKKPFATQRSRRWAFVLPLAAALLSGACLDEPEIDERWTLIELTEIRPQPGQTVPGDQAIDVTASGRITYRQIITGFLVAEVRYSDTVLPGSVALDPTRHTLAIAADIDNVLANSVTAGRATKPITGWDHLMQDVSLSFTAQVPAAMFPGGAGPAAGALYLVMYVGEGDEIRLQDGRDSLVVTPFRSVDYELLHTGFPLDVTPPGGGP